MKLENKIEKTENVNNFINIAKNILIQIKNRLKK